jgi:hypothetical protein
MKPQLTESSVLRRSPSAAFQVLEGEAILIHVPSGTYFSLNKVGTELWQMLDGRQDIAACAATLAGRYQVEESVVIADLLELGEKMAAEGLVEAA